MEARWRINFLMMFGNERHADFKSKIGMDLNPRIYELKQRYPFEVIDLKRHRTVYASDPDNLFGFYRDIERKRWENNNFEL